ncbi:MAG: hypothetical protein EOL87_12430 [Spartobacteria bacterium]|nr:hypothetical protein [Spartobacteria bacterium]
MTSVLKRIVMVWLMCGMSVFATVYWVPDKPTKRDHIKIFVSSTNGAGEVHWGINAKNNGWEQVVPEYVPDQSYMTGAAVRTPMEAIAVPGVYVAEIGPFDTATQVVRGIDFVMVWSNSIWEKNGEKDYHIDVSQGRISVKPKKPTVNDEIRITIHDAPKGKKGQLRWGVNAERGAWQPPDAVYWTKGTVPSTDGLAVDSPIHKADSDGISTIVLGPFNNGVQVVTSLHMAVHWGDDWDTDFGHNYNVDISLTGTDSKPVLQFARPKPEQSMDAPFQYTLTSTANQPAAVWLDGRPLKTELKPPYDARLDTYGLTYGRHRLTAESEKSDGSKVLAAVDFWFVPPFRQVFRSSREPFGTTFDTNGLVTFALFAPDKKYVSLIGTMNDWDPEAHVMNYSPNGIWWTTMQLTNGTYEYQYVIDGKKTLADPYSTDVNWTDEKGQETWKSELARSVIQVGQSPFAWEDETYQRPPLKDLIVYELFIEDFCPGEGFKGVTKRLDYIQSLGINAIEPLPWNEFTGSSSWGYNPSFHFAPESWYGTPEDLKEMINEAHKRGIAVIMDTVLNHLDGRSPLFELYGTDYAASPYFYDFKGENWGFPDLDQASPAVKRYVADLMRFWVDDYHIDGFRYDATRWVGWKGYNDEGASWFAYAAKMANTNTYTIAEHIPADPDLVNLTEMDTGWHAFFHWRMKDMLKNKAVYSNDFSRLMQPVELGFEKETSRMPYVESHDEERMMYVFHEKGMDKDEAMRRCILGNVLTLTAPGVPMLYAGQEWGEDTQKKVGDNPLHWNYLRDVSGKTIFDATEKLVHLRGTNPALIGGWTELIENDEARKVIVYQRTFGGRSVLVGANLGNAPEAVAFPLSFAGTWTDILTGRTLNIRRPITISQRLPAGACVVFSGAPAESEEQE